MTVRNGVIVPRGASEIIDPRDVRGLVVLTSVEATQLYGEMGGGGAILLFTRDGAGDQGRALQSPT